MVKGHTEIRIEPFYDPPDEADGTRALVHRLWPRGLRKENAVLTLWLKEIAPSSALRKWFGQDPTHWAEFGRRHRAELARDDEAVAKTWRNNVARLMEQHGDAELTDLLGIGRLAERWYESRIVRQTSRPRAVKGTRPTTPKSFRGRAGSRPLTGQSSS